MWPGSPSSPTREGVEGLASLEALLEELRRDGALPHLSGGGGGETSQAELVNKVLM